MEFGKTLSAPPTRIAVAPVPSPTSRKEENAGRSSVHPSLLRSFASRLALSSVAGFLKLICCVLFFAVTVAPVTADEHEQTRTEEVVKDEARDAEKSISEEESGGVFSYILNIFRSDDAEDEPETIEEAGRESPANTWSDQEELISDGSVSFDHVYQASTDLLQELEILRQVMGVTGEPATAEFRPGLTPSHTYVKSLEVMEKTILIQRRLGMIPVELGAIPAKDITPAESRAVIMATVVQLNRIKRQLVVEDEIQRAPLVEGKTASLVYQSLSIASRILNDLVGRTATSHDVHTRVMQVRDEMELIARKLQVALEDEPPAVPDAKNSTDVAQQLLRAIYKVINLQNRLGLQSSTIPSLTLENVTPTEVHEAATILLAEVLRVKDHLDVDVSHTGEHEPAGVQLADVFGQLLLILENLDIMIRAASTVTQPAPET